VIFVSLVRIGLQHKSFIRLWHTKRRSGSTAPSFRTPISSTAGCGRTELRVAQLAAQGGSNRDIAEMIFVSRNTVAWHLRNVYRKLQIDSREQLTQLVEA
jgi:DNA-binding CsgD family transcriptional regulator